MSHHWQQSPEQSHTDICLAHAKCQRHFLSTQWCPIYFPPSISEPDIITYPLMTTGFLKQPSHHLSENMNTWRFLLGLAQVPAYIQECLYKILKDLPFTIAYLDDIIIYSRTAEEHLDNLHQAFHKLCNAKLSIKFSKCHLFTKNSIFWAMSSAQSV